MEQVTTLSILTHNEYLVLNLEVIDEFYDIQALGKQIHGVVFLDNPETLFLFASFFWYFLDRNFYACELIETQHNRITLAFVNSFHDPVLVKLVLVSLRP